MFLKKEVKRKNLKEALTKVLRAVETGMKAYEDEKINVGEWIAMQGQSNESVDFFI